MTSPEDAQTRLDGLLINDVDPRPLPGAEAAVPFSPFIPEHAARAGDVVRRMNEAAESGGISAAIDAARDAVAEETAGLVKRAAKVFATHHPQARGVLALPAVRAVETRDVVEGEAPPRPVSATPSEAAFTGWEPDNEPAPPGTGDAAALPSRTEPPGERALDWFREDPFANDHHAHWHDVYPTGGPGVSQPRQGELFCYMHQQMLARYDAERVVAGLDPVTPFEPPYTARIAEGYGRAGYATRPPGWRLPDTTDLLAWHAGIDSAIGEGRLRVDGVDLPALDENQLGAAVEPSELYLAPDSDLPLAYGNLHGEGHVQTAMIGAAPFETGGEPQQWPGVMAFTETAIRDPFFYRWHRHIDDLYARLQDSLGENDFERFAAKVRFREQPDGPSVLFCFSDRIPGAGAPDFDFDAFGRERFGEGFGGGELATDELQTGFGLSRVTAPSPGGRETYWTTHLRHRPFSMFVRLENELPTEQRVTLRVFLAERGQVENRRMWIELDKFDATLSPGVNVLGRPDALSSVIKRKGVTAPGAQPPAGTDSWCDCGWPFSLLLPSGASSETGTRFVVMVAVTDWEQDQVGVGRSCASMSYCGAADTYPDARKMGYPFDRPFREGVSDTIGNQPSMTMREVAIRCVNPRPPE